MSINPRKLLKDLDPNESPKAAADQFIAAAKVQNLQPFEAVQLIDSDRMYQSDAISSWRDARPIIQEFFREFLSGGFTDE